MNIISIVCKWWRKSTNSIPASKELNQSTSFIPTVIPGDIHLHWYFGTSSPKGKEFFEKCNSALTIEDVSWGNLSFSEPCVNEQQKILENAISYWQFGEWERLIELEQENIQSNIYRDKLVLLIAAAYQQLGNMLKTKQCIGQAQEWGCSKLLISRILIAGVHNNLGKVSILLKEEQRASMHFKKSVQGGLGDENLYCQVREQREFCRLEEKRIDVKCSGQKEINSSSLVSELNKDVVTEYISASEILQNRSSNYCIKPGYNSRSSYHHYNDMEATDAWQLEVYLHAYALMKKNNLQRVIDLGCGSGYKLITYLGEFHTIGLELKDNIRILNERFPDRDWRESDLNSLESLNADLIVCADVIEHLVDPDEVVDYIVRQRVKYIIISTPDRNIIYNKDNEKQYIDGPPKNVAHVREWSFEEFDEYIRSRLEVISHEIINYKQGTQMIVCKNRQ
jgi:2-polyprenyl-3-methyl-5-hydroxy-6-metoxy-1,4-benzoquinol methylase